MRVQLRLWGALPDQGLNHVVDLAISSGQWSTEDQRPSLPSISRLLRADFRSIEESISLRRSLEDIVVLRSVATAFRERIVVRDGVALHFDLVSDLQVDPPLNSARLDKILAQSRDHLAAIHLQASAAALRFEVGQAGLIDISDETQTLGEVDGEACLTLVDSVSLPTLIYLESLGCPIEGDPIDDWYMHTVSCLAARDLLHIARGAVSSTSVELSEIGSIARADENSLTLNTALEASHRVSALRSELAVRQLQRELIADFRRVCIDSGDDGGHHAKLHRTLDRRHTIYYADPVDIALRAVASSVDQIGERSKALLELANLSYNVDIQDRLTRMQQVSIVIALASLVVAIVAILIVI